MYQLPREVQDTAREVRAPPCQASPCILWSSNCTAHWPHSHRCGFSSWLQIFAQKHAADKNERWVSGNFGFFRMHRISDIYFVGGFGTVQWVDITEYTAVKPDNIVMASPNKTLAVRPAS